MENLTKQIEQAKGNAGLMHQVNYYFYIFLDETCMAYIIHKIIIQNSLKIVSKSLFEAIIIGLKCINYT